MLENVIGRSPKAWGLGQNAEICFPPARGAYFSIKSGQNAIMEGVLRGGVNLLGGVPGKGFSHARGEFFAIFS